jgi:hypothetical protein
MLINSIVPPFLSFVNNKSWGTLYILVHSTISLKLSSDSTRYCLQMSLPVCRRDPNTPTCLLLNAPDPQLPPVCLCRPWHNCLYLYFWYSYKTSSHKTSSPSKRPSYKTSFHKTSRLQNVHGYKTSSPTKCSVMVGGVGQLKVGFGPMGPNPTFDI